MPEELNSMVARHADDSLPAALAAEVCPELPIAPVDAKELHRYLGYPPDAAPAPGMAERIDRIVAEAAPCLRPRGTYSLHPVSGRSAQLLRLGDTTISGKIGEYLREADRVAVFVVTVGEEISHLAESAARDGDALSAWVIDAAGSWAAEAAADALMSRIRRHLKGDEDLTLRYSPGYCGMDIGEQRNLFSLLQASAAGVTLMPSMLMHPLKSISGLVGLAPREAVSRYRSPCDICQRVGCHMRR